jgi:CRP-like cAMP-binding protein
MLQPSPPLSVSRQRNKLLAALSAADLQLLQRHLEPVTLKLRQDLERPNRRIDNVYFIEAGVASVVAVQDRKERVEVGLIGYEGMSGTSVVLGTQSSPHSTYLQVAGDGQRISAAALRDAMANSKTLEALLLKYVQVFMVQTAHTAIANARATLDQRLARWLLMVHDRVPGGELPLTHEFLGLMLGVRRAGVTEALQSLSRQRLIGSGRGQITILNRKGVERRAGELYGVPETEHGRLI